jgi:hypothetical protein
MPHYPSLQDVHLLPGIDCRRVMKGEFCGPDDISPMHSLVRQSITVALTLSLKLGRALHCISIIFTRYCLNSRKSRLISEQIQNIDIIFDFETSPGPGGVKIASMALSGLHTSALLQPQGAVMNCNQKNSPRQDLVN